MYKLDFYIKLKNGYKKVSGWGETFKAPDSSIIEIGFDKRYGLWYITEIASGYRLAPLGFKTRKEAIDYLTPYLCKISSRIREPDIINVANRLSDYILSQDTKGTGK